MAPDVTEAAKFNAPMKTERPPRNHGVASDLVGTEPVTATTPMSELVAYYGGPASDVYFQRARKTLAGARVDAVVAMDFFAGDPGVLCGVAEAVRLLREILEEGDEAYAIAEGEPISAKETALRVRAPYSRFGVYETALLGMMSSCTGWATAAREIVEALIDRGEFVAIGFVVVIVRNVLGLLQDDGVEPVAQRHARPARRFFRGLARFRPDAFDTPRDAEFHAHPRSRWRGKEPSSTLVEPRFLKAK